MAPAGSGSQKTTTDTPSGEQDALPRLATADVPVSTYRVQFHAGFTFKDATAAVPYWKSLGISHLYASPYLKARKGSTHGYDVVDHNTLNPEIGTEADFDELCRTLAAHGMKQLVDIVPNHMGVLEADNAWWLDVMEHGTESAYAERFDIDWQSPVAGLEGKVLVGLLGDQYGVVLEDGQFVLGFNTGTGGFSVTYFEHCFPVDPACTCHILAAAPLPDDALPEQREPLRKLLDGFAALARPAHTPTPAPMAVKTPPQAPRRERALGLRASLVEWVEATPWAPAWIDACLAAYNGRKGDAASFDKLDELLRAQHWRIAHWRTTGQEVNYRRFFDVSTLAAIRTERMDVFEETHRTILRWVDEGRIAGLRIDHPDGLSDPATYLRRLQQRHVLAQRAKGDEPKALYVVVEKILADDEMIPAGWLTHGDTGYHFSNQVNGVFVDTKARQAFDSLYQGFVQQAADYDETLHTAKHLIMRTSLAADLELLTDALHDFARGDRRTCDFTRTALRDAIAELSASFVVYRTYIGTGTHGGADLQSAAAPSDVDRAYIAEAARLAGAYALGSAQNGIEYLCDVLLKAHEEPDLERRRQRLRFATRWQQFTAPVMAKSMEDTTFYRYLRLVSLNDVGGDPRSFGMSVASFHRANDERARVNPHTLLGTSTHDTKRSEDVRARLDVLSEMPELWESTIQRWHVANDHAATPVRTSHATRTPTRNHEYLLYQSLVGAWPFETMDDAGLDDFRQRIQAYMLKAVREAKDATAWLEPDEPYEQGLQAFIDQVLDRQRSSAFLTDLQEFVGRVAPFGAFNSLGMAALKMTSPGVPDVYQGCETWNLSLVDPDNRRPVDLPGLARALALIDGVSQESGPVERSALQEFVAHWTDGRIKLLLTHRLLRWRQAHPALFRDGDYIPILAEGAAAEHVIAFKRCADITACDETSDQCVTVVGRLLYRLTQGDPAGLLDASVWGDTRLALGAGAPAGRWRDVITGLEVTVAPGGVHDGPSVALAEVLRHLPVAVLTPVR